MSAFMVKDETINKVITWLSWEITRSTWLREKLEKVLLFDTSNPDWEKELAQAMFELNLAGVNDRYGEGEAKKFRDLNYRYAPAHGSNIQVLKSMQCWLYQCTGGVQRCELGIVLKEEKRGEHYPLLPFFSFPLLPRMPSTPGLSRVCASLRSDGASLRIASRRPLAALDSPSAPGARSPWEKEHYPQHWAVADSRSLFAFYQKLPPLLLPY